jgi:hypothetical protein
MVGTANDPAGPFPVNNLPYGVFSSGVEAHRCGVAIGDQVLDTTALEESGLDSPSGRGAPDRAGLERRHGSRAGGLGSFARAADGAVVRGFDRAGAWWSRTFCR